MTDYPAEPGAKGLTPDTLATSTEAAEAISPRKRHLWRIALHTIARLGEACPFEAVAASGVKPSALQPRFSELIGAGMLEPTGERRRNPETDKTAAALRLTELARQRMAGNFGLPTEGGTA